MLKLISQYVQILILLTLFTVLLTSNKQKGTVDEKALCKIEDFLVKCGTEPIVFILSTIQFFCQLI